jgi:hypothetical protein
MLDFALMRAAISGSLRNHRLLLLQLVANPILFAIFAAWLLLPVASALQVALNAALALILIVAALALHGGTLDCFYPANEDENAPLKEALRRAARHVVALAICAAIFWLLWRLVNQAETYQDSLPAYLRSELPAVLRRVISQNALDRVFAAGVFTARWILVPGLLLPLALQAAHRGFRGFGSGALSVWWKTLRSLSYWIILILIALVGVLAPQRIMSATPNFDMSTFRMELSSLSIRLIASYLLGLLAWLTACSLVGRRSGTVIHASTAAGNFGRDPTS